MEKGKPGGCFIPDSDTLCQKNKKNKNKKLAGRKLVLLQYPDGADCPLRVTSELKKSEEWLHGGGTWVCLCGKKEK